ncbi:hypothetical protein CRM22_005087 [Opisthorchis felineus]|nr:hypothetical protein CRM22_005087 [Opisthorchis felineus]TGZ66851.1 hypothetical protein CRM22_005087 [Opisthorchis felineus]
MLLVLLSVSHCGAIDCYNTTETGIRVARNCDVCRYNCCQPGECVRQCVKGSYQKACDKDYYCSRNWCNICRSNAIRYGV